MDALGFMLATTLGVSALRARCSALASEREPAPDTAPHSSALAAVASLLEAGGAAAWKYKAEGGFNVALTYVGREPLLRGRLLRLRKSTPISGVAGCASDATAQLRTLLPTVPLQFSSEVMRPLVGTQYVVPGLQVPVSRACLRELASVVYSHAARSAHRLDDKIDESQPCVVLMIDHTMLDEEDAAVLPGVVPRPRRNFCVELKPKCGMPPITTARGDARSGSEPLPIVQSDGPCRYCMHQVEKSLGAAAKVLGGNARARAPGTAASPELLVAAAPLVSHYCPMDLYSRRVDRIFRALFRAAACPQNNFRFFVDGRPTFASELLRPTAAAMAVADAATTPHTSTSHSVSDALDHGMPHAWYDALLQLTGAVDTLVSDLGLDGAELLAVAGVLPFSTTPVRAPLATVLVCALLARVLEQDEVLPILLRCQAMDTHGIQHVASRFAHYAAPHVAARVGKPVDAVHLQGAGAVHLREWVAAAPAAEAELACAAATFAQAAAPAPAAAVGTGDATHASGASTRQAAADASLLRDFMIASSAKDCSMLVCFQVTADAPVRASSGEAAAREAVQRVGDEHLRRNEGTCTLELHTLLPLLGVSLPVESVLPHQLFVRYSIAVVDVDPKSTSRVPHYALQDAGIVQEWQCNGAALFDAAAKQCGLTSGAGM